MKGKERSGGEVVNQILRLASRKALRELNALQVLP